VVSSSTMRMPRPVVMFGSGATMTRTASYRMLTVRRGLPTKRWNGSRHSMLSRTGSAAVAPRNRAAGGKAQGLARDQAGRRPGEEHHRGGDPLWLPPLGRWSRAFPHDAHRDGYQQCRASDAPDHVESKNSVLTVPSTRLASHPRSRPPSFTAPTLSLSGRYRRQAPPRFGL
jgi:hypothetical protein